MCIISGRQLRGCGRETREHADGGGVKGRRGA